MSIPVLRFVNSRVSKLTERINPFVCSFCQEKYFDYGPLIVVVFSDLSRRHYCTDACADDAGLNEVVSARVRFEAETHALAILYRYPTS